MSLAAGSRSLRSVFSLRCKFLRRRSLHEASQEFKEDFVSIHPTAIVHPNAVIGKDVSIGPFCTIGSEVKIGDACKMHAGSHVVGNTKVGEQCILQTGSIVGADLPGQTIVGNNNIIGHHAVVGVKCQDLKYKKGDDCFLYIGNNNEIREYCSIHLSSKPSDKTVIGDNNLIMGSCHIAHDCKVGNNNILANNTLLAGHVVVEDFAHTAGAAAVHQFCHIGSYSFIGGGSVITQDVPKYMMVSGDRAEIRGLNLEGLRRHGFSSIEVANMKKAYMKLFMPKETNCFDKRLAEVEKELAHFPSVYAMVQSVRESFGQNRRGICKYRNWSGS